jgi:hypothetical protein
MTTTVMSHLHATRPVARHASDVVTELRRNCPALAADATEHALAAIEPLLRDGGFQRPATPRTETEVLTGGPATIRVTWNRNGTDRWPPSTRFATRPTSRWWRTDEEETGWPTATLDILVEPRATGSRIAVLSSRPPGTDQSTNRIDRRLRDRIARAAVEAFLDALATTLDRA